MDKLTNLKSFTRVVECGSISAAARSLNLTQPAVSQHLRNLEKELGVRLINRTTRNLVLTEAGEIYYNQVGDLLEKLIEADRSVQAVDQHMSGTLRVSMPIGFGQNIFANFFIGFKQQYPNLKLDLDLRDEYVDVVNSRMDVAVRLGPIVGQGLIVRKLGVAKRGLAAAPEYLDRRGRPQTPEDLINHDYILFSRLATNDIVPLTHDNGEKVNVRINANIKVNSAAFIRTLMAAGLGIGLSQIWLLKPGIEAGKLEYVLPEWSYEPHEVHIVYPSNRYIPAKVRRFVEALSEYLKGLGVYSE